jgi:hypothetical protein
MVVDALFLSGLFFTTLDLLTTALLERGVSSVYSLAVQFLLGLLLAILVFVYFPSPPTE